MAWLAAHGQAASYDATDLPSGLLMLICGDVHSPRPAVDAHPHPPVSGVGDGAGQGSGRVRQARRAGRRRTGQLPGRRQDRGDPHRHASWPARAAPSPTSPSATAWNWWKPCGGSTPAAARRRSTSICGCALWASSPTTHRTASARSDWPAGRLTIEQLVDRYRIQCRPIRDLLVDYLRERQPSLDFASLDAVSRTLAGLFWARIEALAPGIDHPAAASRSRARLEGRAQHRRTHHDQRLRRAEQGAGCRV